MDTKSTEDCVRSAFSRETSLHVYFVLFLESYRDIVMRPEKVSSWRERLPPPFDKPSPPLKRCDSAARLEVSIGPDDEVEAFNRPNRRKRRDSAPDAVDQVDRSVKWLRFIHDEYTRNRRKRSELAVDKLRRLKSAKLQTLSIDSTPGSSEDFRTITNVELIRQRSMAFKSGLEEPTRDELSALAVECFPRVEESRVIITEYSSNALRTSEYTLEEVLASDCILQPGDLVPRVRWIYVEYYKMGTFWGSGERFSQWGTDPVLFEKSPILLLQERLAELDRKAGRPPLEGEDIPGYKRIGKYYRQAPGCPEFLGLRINSSAWLNTEPYKLLLDFLALRPGLCKALQRYKQNDLQYGLAYIDAVRCIRDSAYHARPGLREVHHIANLEEVYVYGAWDDNVERVEFYREHTLLSCGSPRFYKIVADRLFRKEDVLRQQPDCALLYYALVRVSIENEMMQDAPERALNKVFARLMSNRGTGREHIELIFNLQQAVLDGLEYLEENKRELPIWGIPPFDNHRVCFHPKHTPPPEIRKLIQDEMDLVDKDFDEIIGHWKSLRSKVDRYLDILLQFRVLEQQELTVSQSHLATQQRSLAIDEARSSRVQSRSVLIFTAITIIFLPLSFVTSYFGMNLNGIVNTAHTSTYFWLIAGPVSGSIVIAIFAVMKVLSAVKDPVLDEEKAKSSSEAAEDETTWGSRLGLRKTKVKSN